MIKKNTYIETRKKIGQRSGFQLATSSIQGQSSSNCLLAYGAANCNERAAARFYEQKYPELGNLNIQPLSASTVTLERSGNLKVVQEHLVGLQLKKEFYSL